MTLAWPLALRGQNRAAEKLISAPPVEESAKKLLPSVWLYGPMSIDEAAARCRGLLAERPLPRTAASCYRCLGALEAMTGRFDEARALLESDRLILEELGLGVLIAAGTSSIIGMVELLAGEPARAERALRAGMKRLSRLGKTMHFSAVATFLARALHEQGRDDEAWSMARVAEKGPIHDVAVRVGLRGIRSKLLVGRGGADQAERVARDAVRLAGETDSPDLQGDALSDLADVLLRAGKAGEGSATLGSAIERYEQKGNSVAAGRARSRLEGL